MKWIENMAPAPFGVLLLVIWTVGIFSGIWANMDYHTCPAPVMPTRPVMQMFLREHYGYAKSIDGYIGGGSNDAWLLYELDLANENGKRIIDRFGGINGDEK